jgi:hypothetical protein
MLIKHIDHKTILKEPNMQLDIVEVATSLAQYAKVQPSVSIIGAVSDMMRHLRKTIHCSLDNSNLDTDVINWNKNFRDVVDKCLVMLANKVPPQALIKFMPKHSQYLKYLLFCWSYVIINRLEKQTQYLMLWL